MSARETTTGKAGEPRRATLLATMFATEGTADEAAAAVAADLATGSLELTGNFKGHEREIAAQARG